MFDLELLWFDSCVNELDFVRQQERTRPDGYRKCNGNFMGKVDLIRKLELVKGGRF